MPRPSAKQTFASLSHRNYRLWFTGQAASLIGTWMQFTAQGFLVFKLTHSPAFLGYVSFAYGAFELKAGDDADVAMARADEAMYAHKRGTR